MIDIIPSLASANQLCLQSCLDQAEAVQKIHLDIEDGNFVPNITFGMKIVSAVAAYTNCTLDAHLMVTNPDFYLDELLRLGIRKIAFHIESTIYPAQYLYKIKQAGGVAGLAFNCMADVADALPYVSDLDYVLIMTSEPDGRGQRFNSYMLEKIREARRLLPEHISIMVDGGISEQELLAVRFAGADCVVMGRAIWSASDPAAAYTRLMELANGA